MEGRKDFGKDVMSVVVLATLQLEKVTKSKICCRQMFTVWQILPIFEPAMVEKKSAVASV